MTALRLEVNNLIEKLPEESLEKVLNYLKNFLQTEETLAEKNVKWLAEPDKYADEINECISKVIKEVHREKCA